MTSNCYTVFLLEDLGHSNCFANGYLTSSWKRALGLFRTIN